MRNAAIEEVVSTLKDEFNIDMEIYQVVRHSAKALELMGMIAMKKEVMNAMVENHCIKLPPEVVKIASVICLSKPVNTSVGAFEIQSIYHPPQIVWRSDETDTDLDQTTSPDVKANYIPSQHYGYINYVWECPYLKFNDTDIEVMVEYSTMSLDDKGYPKIPETAIDGCVHWAVFKHMQPLFMMGKIQPAVFAEVTRWKDQKMNQSRNKTMMRGLNNNTRNRVLNILSSFDRKRVNIDA